MSNLKTNLEKVSALQSSGKSVIFTNGCFDILHVGHVDYLTEASKLGDILIVAINSDDSVKRLEKGEGRPVNSEIHRLKLISSLRCVDLAFVFDDDTPLNIINQIKPDILVKGADYDSSETDETSSKYIVGSKEVTASGGKVQTIELTEGFSTTSLIEKIKRAY